MWKFLISSSNKANWLKHDNKEICFIGRSNVGKSSLINALANNKIAKTSNTPGRTQLINFFQNQNTNIIVDLPGYGYAKMSKSLSAKMFDMIEEYFSLRENLLTTFLLFDSRIGLTEKDYQMLEFLESINRNVILVATKIDKLNQSQIYKVKKEIEILNKYECFFVSSAKKKNINILNQKINELFLNGK
ncbi:ribosome biogenesis GTP-binding protein YihA/YsxC [Mesomycoplasma molare]|uniref:Probable GTP-binding protein EngB n=1 Tax=Mesomycoplasma molare TaxID=171288 RepID=A0ABY5TTI9_9BACT|nr:ribosome biogenesis GTP-binding protein YihA/YsxC [Mesomycoplasma molare]UWD33982.1 ribosome biogenesis GTP-binding protein YihA/YsxC [Mesomycoplasma molare]